MTDIRKNLGPQTETLIAALIGIAMFTVLRLPTPTLSGAMVGVAILLVLGREARLAAPLRDIGMLISGVAMGASVTPQMLRTVHHYPFSLLLLFVLMAVGMFLSYQFFRLVGQWGRETAFFASVPGALSVVMSSAAGTKADILKVSMAQSVRLFVLFAVLPSLVTLQGAASVLPAKDVLGPLPFAVSFVGGGLLAFLFMKLAVAAPWIFGGMLVSAVLHGSGVIAGDVHPSLTQIGFGLVGIFIGTRFSGITRETFLNLVLVSLGSVAIGLAVTVSGAALAERVLTGVTFGQAVVAFAPGALEGMVVLGAALGLDPIYVGLHHLVRFFSIGVIIPVVTPFIKTTD
jgi:uncharacterized protein